MQYKCLLYSLAITHACLDGWNSETLSINVMLWNIGKRFFLLFLGDVLQM